MKVQIRDAEVFRGLNSHDLAAYLRTTGWREAETNPEHSSVWLRAVGPEDVELLLPLNRAFGDFTLRMADAVATLATVENRSALEILSDLLESNADVIRIRLKESAAVDGSVLLDRGVPLVENAREMMLAAACATVEQRARFATRKPDAANAYVRGLRLGQSERGSYVLKILSPVPPSLMSQKTLFGEVEEPFERRAVLTLMRALRAMRMASDRALALATFDQFEEAVGSGVSSNLCDAVVKMGGPVQPADELVVSWTSARSRPAEGESAREVSIPADSLPVIAEAARLYRASSPLESIELRGAVVKLQRDEPGGFPAGPVTILAFVDGAPRKVSVMLADAEHQAAVEAYRRGATVICSGDVVRQGSQFVLQNPKGFTVLRDD